MGEDGITSKEVFLGQIESGILTHNRMDSEESHISIYGDTGVIVSRGTSAGTYNGTLFSMHEWSTNVFCKFDGQWKCVLTMLSPAK